MRNFAAKKIRVAMVIQEYYPIIGGAEHQLASQAALLKEMGVDIHIVTRRWPGLLPYEVIRGIPVHRMLSWGPRPLAAVLFITTAIWKIIRLNPDIIHAFELLSPSTVAVLAKKILRRPLIIKVLRGGILGDLRKIGSGFLGRFRIPFVLHAAEAFAVISHEIDAELESFGVSGSRRFFIPNGVDTQRFSPVTSTEKEALRIRLGLPTGVLAVFTGRLESEKRLDMLIKIWTSIRAKHPNANLLLVGTGSQEAYLRSIAGDGVWFTGGVDDVAPYLQSSDIFVLPSVAEGLSNALLEGLSCELGVIATNIGGTTDIIRHEKNGLLVPPDSPDHTMEAFLRLLSDPEYRHQLGVEGRKLIVEDYSIENVVKKIRQLYSSLTGDEGN